MLRVQCSLATFTGCSWHFCVLQIYKTSPNYFNKIIPTMFFACIYLRNCPQASGFDVGRHIIHSGLAFNNRHSEMCAHLFFPWWLLAVDQMNKTSAESVSMPCYLIIRPGHVMWDPNKGYSKLMKGSFVVGAKPRGLTSGWVKRCSLMAHWCGKFKSRRLWRIVSNTILQHSLHPIGNLSVF